MRRDHCRCEAYRFPHRRYSGKCYAEEIERDEAAAEKRAAIWWRRKFNGRPGTQPEYQQRGQGDKRR